MEGSGFGRSGQVNSPVPAKPNSDPPTTVADNAKVQPPGEGLKQGKLQLDHILTPRIFLSSTYSLSHVYFVTVTQSPFAMAKFQRHHQNQCLRSWLSALKVSVGLSNPLPR
jgi:hypothetical protein